jgi:hypothetical protein
VTVSVTPISGRRFADYQQRISGAPSAAALDNLAELIQDSHNHSRLLHSQYLMLAGEMAVRRTQLASALALVAASRSPHLCHLCSGLMLRTVGVASDPDTDGRPVVDEIDECEVCGIAVPVGGDEWDRTEVRRRIALVRAHRAVTDHRECAADAPCNASRPGLPAVPVEAVQP